MEDFNSKKWNKREAKTELVKLEALKVLIKNNTLACTLEIAGMSFGLCDNSQALPLIEFQEQEIHKFLKGKKNIWI